MRKLVGKIMRFVIGYGLAIQGMYEDQSCYYPEGK